MDKLTAKQWANIQWAKGRNPIHLFGNVYLVRYESPQHFKISLYLIKIFKNKS